MSRSPWGGQMADTVERDITSTMGGGGSRRTVAGDKYGFEMQMQMQMRRKG